MTDMLEFAADDEVLEKKPTKPRWNMTVITNRPIKQYVSNTYTFKNVKDEEKEKFSDRLANEMPMIVLEGDKTTIIPFHALTTVVFERDGYFD